MHFFSRPSHHVFSWRLKDFEARIFGSKGHAKESLFELPMFQLCSLSVVLHGSFFSVLESSAATDGRADGQ
jgi:hypothetical protein